MRLKLLLIFALCISARYLHPATFAAPAASQRAFTIDIDTSDAPEMADLGKQAKEVAEKWYPLIIEKLPSDGFVAPDHVTIVFHKDYKGVAAAGADRITCSVDYFTKHPDDLGHSCMS